MTGSVRGRRAGIKDVAAAAGVSTQTVSNVVNRRGRFAGATRDRVLAEVARLGYRPHGAAQNLRYQRTMLLGLPLTADILLPGNVVMAEFLQASVAAAADIGYQVVVSGGADSAAGIDAMIAEARVDAFLLADLDDGDLRLATVLAAQAPFACFGRTPPGQPQSWVDIDNAGAVRAVVAHLVDRGHREFAYVGYSDQRFWDVARERGFELGLRAAGVAVGPRHLHRVTQATAGEVVRDFLREPRRPTAVVTGSDALAVAVYAAAAAEGLQVGNDLAVTGFDGSALGRALVPSLTSAVIPVEEVARSVVRRAVDEIDGQTGLPGQLLTARLVVGDSSAGPPPARDVDTVR